MKVRYDKDVDVLYFSFSKNKIKESDEGKPGIVIDYDKNGSIVGIEVLDASRKMPNPAKVEYEDEEVLAIHDINPQAPLHLLIIPKKHSARVGEMQVPDVPLLGNLIFQARQIAAHQGWEDYRLVFNNGAAAGQTVFHIHLHLLAGRRMNWPPG